MARIPEHGTLGFNRGRADNEPLYGDGLGNVSSAPPEQFGDDPVWKMRQQHMASGALDGDWNASHHRDARLAILAIVMFALAEEA